MKIRAFGQILVAATVIGVNLTACGPTKVAQCNALASEINKVSGLGEKFKAVNKALVTKGSKIESIQDSHNLTKESSENVASLVEELDSFTNQVKGVELKDEKLVGYRDQAVTFYTKTSKSLKDLGTVLGSFSKLEVNESGKKMIQDSSKKLDASIKEIQQAHKEEQALAKALNEYCGVETKYS
jgi:hypothetical protein